MNKPVLDRSFWRDRLKQARYPHQAVYYCSLGEWREIQARHASILKDLISPDTSVLDAGCAHGRMLEAMPNDWHGEYLGVDLSPDLIDLARRTHMSRKFVCGDLLKVLPELETRFDVAIASSLKQMLSSNCGEEYWKQVESELLRVVDKLIILEYRETKAEIINAIPTQESPVVRSRTEDGRDLGKDGTVG